MHGPEGIGKLAFAEAAAQTPAVRAPRRGGRGVRLLSRLHVVRAGQPSGFPAARAGATGETDEAEEGREKKASVQIDVKQVRALEAFINLIEPSRRRPRVVIHPAEALNPSAANALLKSLEEPPPQTYFLLVAHRWHYLLPTIRSRCRLVGLRCRSRGRAGVARRQGRRRPARWHWRTRRGAARCGGVSIEEYWACAERCWICCARAFDPLAAAEELRDVAPGRSWRCCRNGRTTSLLQQAARRCATIRTARTRSPDRRPPGPAGDGAFPPPDGAAAARGASSAERPPVPGIDAARLRGLLRGADARRAA
jgi:hypothetical protein